MKRFFVSVILVFVFSSIVYAIDVSGHISEDITWSPDNNPYIVVDNIWVDANVTLTILPGTIVKFETSSYPIGDYFFGDGDSEAKFLKVSGRIIAEGTVQDSIIFTKNCDETDRRWGVIILDYLSADDSIFDHCRIEYSFRMQLYSGGDTYSGAVTLSNARATIRNCYFKNYHSAIHGFYDSSPWIYKNYFICNDENANNYTWAAIRFHDNIGTKPYISYNTFEDCQGIHLLDVNTSSYSAITYNTFINCNNGITYKSPGIIYKNDFIDGLIAIDIGDYSNYYEVLIKQNVFNSLGGVQANSRVIVADNLFTNGVGGIALTQLSDNSIIVNNIIVNQTEAGIYVNNNNTLIANNLIYNCIEYGIITLGGTETTPKIINNIIAGSEIGIDVSSYCDIFNNIIFDIEDYSISSSDPNGIINSSNNCFSAPLYLNMVTYNDLGGNIIDDPMLVDPLNGNHHLSNLSPCIDTGTEDTSGFNLPVYDMDFNERIWDGDNNGIPIIDMGCYEFGSQSAMGGIEGFISLNYTNNFLPFTEIDVNGTLAFPDTMGYYELKLLPGNYELNAYLEGYEEVTIPNIEVIAGEYTSLDFEMISLVSIEEYEVQTNDFLLSNYPNPFNPETTISFNIPESGKVVLEIYNIKGQKVVTLINEYLEQGSHSKVWSGFDSNNIAVSSGIYFYKVKTGNQETVRRMLLVK